MAISELRVPIVAGTRIGTRNDHLYAIDITYNKEYKN
jgi:hypothetical protein